MGTENTEWGCGCKAKRRRCGMRHAPTAFVSLFRVCSRCGSPYLAAQATLARTCLYRSALSIQHPGTCRWRCSVATDERLRCQPCRFSEKAELDAPSGATGDGAEKEEGGRSFRAGRAEAGIERQGSPAELMCMFRCSVEYIGYAEARYRRRWETVPSHIFSKPTVCLLYTSPSPRDATLSRMPSSA